jgi:hypothetical protein
VSRNFVGIDPGLTGAIVVLSEKLELKYFAETPTYQKKSGKKTENLLDFTAMSDILFGLEDFNPSLILLEEVHSMPKQGVASTFKFGRTFGATQAFLEAYDYNYRLVTPQVWTKFQYEGYEFDKDLDTKKKSKEVVKRKFPDIAENFVSETARKADSYHDGMVDALLIADYARNLFFTEMKTRKK